MAEGGNERSSDCSSYYYLTLDKVAQDRYKEKLAMLGNIQDPYFTMNSPESPEGMSWQNWPNVSYPDIYNYFVETPSIYTKQELKAYKSLDGYKYFVDGWVSDVLVLPLVSSCRTDDVFLSSCKVKHSQRLSIGPVQPWVAVEKEGLVICAHCNCMAGLGEACSHIAALLFTLEANSQIKKGFSCTSLPCYWLPPSFKSVPFARICDIDFTSPQAKLKKICKNEQLSHKASTSNIGSPQDPPAQAQKTMKPSVDELDNFYKTLSEAGTKPAILSIVPGYCEAYVPLQVTGDLPPSLSNLYNEQFASLSYPELLSKCEEVYASLSITQDQAKLVENKTRTQSRSKTWFQQRSGRITASRLKASVHTKIAQPSQSLIKSICYPESHRFSTKATEWGCEHEKTAIDTYTNQYESLHSGFSVSIPVAS